MLLFIPWGYVVGRRLERLREGQRLSAGERFIVGAVCTLFLLFGLLVASITPSNDSLSVTDKLVFSVFSLILVVFGAFGIVAAALGWLEHDLEFSDLKFWKKKPIEDENDHSGEIVNRIAEEFFGRSKFKK